MSRSDTAPGAVSRLRAPDAGRSPRNAPHGAPPTSACGSSGQTRGAETPDPPAPIRIAASYPVSGSGSTASSSMHV